MSAARADLDPTRNGRRREIFLLIERQLADDEVARAIAHLVSGLASGEELRCTYEELAELPLGGEFLGNADEIEATNCTSPLAPPETFGAIHEALYQAFQRLGIPEGRGLEGLEAGYLRQRLVGWRGGRLRNLGVRFNFLSDDSVAFRFEDPYAEWDRELAGLKGAGAPCDRLPSRDSDQHTGEGGLGASSNVVPIRCPSEPPQHRGRPVWPAK